MQFKNPQISSSELPDLDDIVFSRVDAKYPWVVATLTLLVLTALTATVYVAMLRIGGAANMPPNWLFGTIGIVVLTATLMSFAYAKSFRYAVRKHDIVLNKGVFWRTEIVQPLIRMQHVELHRGPLDKSLGLAKLKLYSAGSARETFTIPGLPLRLAARIRRFILSAQRG